MKKVKNHTRNRWALTAIVIILLVGGLAVGLHLRHVHDAQHTSGTIPTSKKISTPTTTSDKSQASSVSQTNTSSASGTKQPGATSGTSVVLVAPFGSFVSNHRPGLNNSPTTEQSVCNTTPGATCNIQFTNGSGVTKNLGAETVDGNGTAYWSWSIDGANLASGNWQITAVATLNGQTQTTTDPTPLEVQ